MVALGAENRFSQAAVGRCSLPSVGDPKQGCGDLEKDSSRWDPSNSVFIGTGYSHEGAYP